MGLYTANVISEIQEMRRFPLETSYQFGVLSSKESLGLTIFQRVVKMGIAVGQ